MGKLLGFLVSLLLVAAIAALGAWFVGQQIYTAPGPETEDGAPRVVRVEKGATVTQIANELQEAGAIENAARFRIAMRAHDELSKYGLTHPAGVSLKAGEYSIPSGASMAEIADLLSTGKSVQYAVIVPEGLTSEAIIHLLTDREWEAAGKTEGTIKLQGDPPAIPPEGSMLPGDYMVESGETIQSVVDRMTKAQADLMAELWDGRKPALPFETQEQALILASIVEKETGIPQERPQVASVFVNRLSKKPPMRLETDPTIIYGVCLKRPDSCVDGKLVDKDGRRRPIRASEIALDTGYNTYRIDGLPPTPICNPGRDAIAAVLNPPDTDYLFFVADGSGGHAFSKTYREHQKNVKNWRPIEASRLAEEKSEASAKE